MPTRGAGGPGLGSAPGRPGTARLGLLDQFQDEPAGGRVGLAQARLDLLTEPVGAAPAPPHEAMACLDVVVVVIREQAHRHEAVGAGLVEGDEQAEAGDAVDRAWEHGADPLLQEGGGESVERVALGRDGAPLRAADMLADLGEAARGILG